MHSKPLGWWLYAIAIRARVCCDNFDLRLPVVQTEDLLHRRRGGGRNKGLDCCEGVDRMLTTDSGRGGESTQSRLQHQ